MAVKFENEILGNDPGDGDAGYVGRLLRAVVQGELEFFLEDLAEVSDMGDCLLLILEGDAEGGCKADNSRDVERS